MKYHLCVYLEGGGRRRRGLMEQNESDVGVRDGGGGKKCNNSER